MAAMKVMKAKKNVKATKKPAASNTVTKEIKPLKKPVACLTTSSLATHSRSMSDMSVVEKMEYYSQSKKMQADGVDAFLTSLSDKDRQAVWQSFAYARSKSADAAKQYAGSCRGVGSDDKKKALLHAFLAAGRDIKSKVYVNEACSLGFTSGTKDSKEWVPFAAILKKYGIAETRRRLSKGSISFRKDPSDPSEYQFLDQRLQMTHEETVSHKHEANKGGASELASWLKLKGYTKPQEITAGMGGDEMASFLSEQGVHKKQKKLAITDGLAPFAGMEEEEEQEEEEGEEKGDGHMLKLKSMADQLSNVSEGTKKKAKDRLEGMLKVCNAVKAHIECQAVGQPSGGNKTKIDKCLEPLEQSARNLKKYLTKTTLNMEGAKTVLVEAAKNINSAKRVCQEILK